MSETMSKSPSEVAELHSYHPDIVKMAVGSYALLGNSRWRDPETIYRRHFCVGVNQAFYSALSSLGYDPRGVIRTRGLLQRHDYVDLESDRGLILIDGTWQQYVPKKKRTASLPRVAVGTAAEVVDLAANAGVSNANLVYWEEERDRSVAYEYRGRLDSAPDFGDEIFAGFDDDMNRLQAYRVGTKTE